MKKKELQKQASQYVKIVEWSEVDDCFIGRCPELFGGGVHGPDEAKVYAELCEVVTDVLGELAGDKAPAPIAAQSYSGKFLLRTGADLHKALVVRAYREGKSLNQVCLEAIRERAMGALKA